MELNSTAKPSCSNINFNDSLGQQLNRWNNNHYYNWMLLSIPSLFDFLSYLPGLFKYYNLGMSLLV